MKLEDFVQEKIKWLGHASFRIDGSKSTVYIDPWKLKNPEPADIICITHSHFDHLSPEDVALIRKNDTSSLDLLIVKRIFEILSEALRQAKQYQ